MKLRLACMHLDALSMSCSAIEKCKERTSEANPGDLCIYYRSRWVADKPELLIYLGDHGTRTRHGRHLYKFLSYDGDVLISEHEHVLFDELLILSSISDSLG